MDFEEEHDEELMLPPSYDDSSLPNPSRVKMPTHHGQGGELPSVALPTRNSGKGRYRECLKNHALSIGGHALDGCCEFMPAGADGTLDALKCAACNCHRNFHRKEITDTAPPAVGPDPYLLPPHHPHNNPYHNRHHQQPFPQFAACYRAQGAGYLHVAGQQRGGSGGGGAPPPATLALPSISGAGGGTQSTKDEEHEDVSEPSGGGGGGSSSSKKRFRTKFTQEQKDKMLDLAEKLGWRIQKHDDVAVQEFCQETGVKRSVFKVWMHNNKHTLGKKP